VGNSPLREAAVEIRRAARRAAELTSQLLAFGRRQVLQPKVLGLNGVVSRMETMLRRLIGEEMDLRTILAEDLWSVKVDPGQIEQVVMNLAINARDAMPGGGTITIRTSNLYLGKDSSGDGPPLPPGRYVQLSISDTGEGMDEETRSRVFEPFFSTKKPGKGTGLGLSTVYGIVEQSGGYISVHSEAGTGSTFRVLLPRAEEPKPAAGETPRPPDGAPRGEGTILVAEDDEPLRRLAVRVLEKSGYRVLSAGDGEEALRVAGAHEGEIALLLTDVIMPRMGGGQLYERLREMRPGTKVIYMSGYAGEEIAQRAVMDSKAAFLQKPCTPASIARKVKDVLADRGL
ncbi:MAG: ATP-binding protein, partial [Thermodesulfobacteriota bacterium]